MTRWVVSERRLSAMRTESTRKGMSSDTTSTMLWVERQPCCGCTGLYTRTLGVPGRRWCAKLKCESAAP